MAGYYFLKTKSGVTKGAGLSVDITDVLKTLGKVGDQSEKAIKATISDVRSRAPGWINKAIRSDYTVETKEIKKALHVKKGQGQFLLGGIPVDNVVLEYKGRMLTPIHFNMSPKTKPARKRYNINVEIKRGQRQRLAGKAKYARPPFLSVAPNTEGKTIPWQREGKKRLPIVSIKTLSVPQMVSSQNKVKPSVEKAVSKGLEDRAWHQFKRFVLK